MSIPRELINIPENRIWDRLFGSKHTGGLSEAAHHQQMSLNFEVKWSKFQGVQRFYTVE